MQITKHQLAFIKHLSCKLALYIHSQILITIPGIQFSYLDLVCQKKEGGAAT